MTTASAAPKTLLDLIGSIPAAETAIIVPEQAIRVSYGALREQVERLAGALAASGVARGDRVGIALPNGLPTIVSFLAASLTGTAAPLNPSYRIALPDSLTISGSPSSRARAPDSCSFSLISFSVAPSKTGVAK